MEDEIMVIARMDRKKKSGCSMSSWTRNVRSPHGFGIKSTPTSRRRNRRGSGLRERGREGWKKKST